MLHVRMVVVGNAKLVQRHVWQWRVDAGVCQRTTLSRGRRTTGYMTAIPVFACIDGQWNGDRALFIRVSIVSVLPKYLLRNCRLPVPSSFLCMAMQVFFSCLDKGNNPDIHTNACFFCEVFTMGVDSSIRYFGEVFSISSYVMAYKPVCAAFQVLA